MAHNIIGVALTQAGKFLGFVDGRGKIRKGRVRKVNPALNIHIGGIAGANTIAATLRRAGYKNVRIQKVIDKAGKSGQVEYRVKYSKKR